jgi:hypothetical protein
MSDADYLVSAFDPAWPFDVLTKNEMRLGRLAEKRACSRKSSKVPVILSTGSMNGFPERWIIIRALCIWRLRF